MTRYSRYPHIPPPPPPTTEGSLGMNQINNLLLDFSPVEAVRLHMTITA